MRLTEPPNHLGLHPVVVDEALIVNAALFPQRAMREPDAHGTSSVLVSIECVVPSHWQQPSEPLHEAIDVPAIGTPEREAKRNVAPVREPQRRLALFSP